ncbi:MAG TPA: hypothetical protein VGM88_21525 [Kofleriaceae bacterium]|jgi:hypothetical protein
MRLTTLGSILAGLALVACGPGARSGSANGGDDTGSGDDTGGDDGGGNHGGDGGSNDDCSDAAKKVYVVDENNTLSTFTPPATFTDIGTLNCSQTGATPFSMGIDRNAIAWVLYSDGTLYNVDPSQTPLTCTPTAWQNSTGGNMVFGMGFSTDSSGGDTDTLFIAGGSGPDDGTGAQLNSVDVTASPITAQHVGSALPGWPELTGNALAELWGFFPSVDGTTQPKVGRINKTSGAVDPTYTFNNLGGAGQTATAWAFAFYGGSYYIFLATGDEFGDTTPTVVYSMDESGSLASTSGTQTSRTIVGAGVSTCAPIVIGRTQ